MVQMKSGQGIGSGQADSFSVDCPEKTGSCADFPEAFFYRIHESGIPEVLRSSRRPESGHKKDARNPVAYAEIETISCLFLDFAWHCPVPEFMQVDFPAGLNCQTCEILFYCCVLFLQARLKLYFSFLFRFSHDDDHSDRKNDKADAIAEPETGRTGDSGGNIVREEVEGKHVSATEADTPECHDV